MKPRKLLLYGLLSPLLLLLYAVPSLGVVFVNTATGDDGNSGLDDWANAVKTIKKGVEIASTQPDLTVWVAKGTYSEAASINLPAGMLVYGGFNGSELPPFDLNTRTFIPPTIVQPSAGTQTNSIFIAAGDNVIDGFTIQGGAAATGAAIRLATNASATISNDIIQNNSSATAGAGVFALADAPGSTLAITSAKFAGNQADIGGAVFAGELSVSISGCIFQGNSAHNGGAIAVQDGVLTVSGGSVFTGNTAKDAAGKPDAGGGAIYALNSGLYVLQSTFSSNGAIVAAENGGSAVGGAIATISGSLLRVDGNIFDTCIAGGGGVATHLAYGGAIYTSGTPATYRNNIFSHCGAVGAGDPQPALGGAIYFANPAGANIRNNTFYDSFVTPQAGIPSDPDRPYGQGAAIYLVGSSAANVINNIITHSRGTAVVNNGMSVTFNYNLLWHNAGGDTFRITFPTYSTNPLLNKDFNIMKDPQFRHAASGDFHITYGSPARDAGLNQSAPSTDIDGEPRPFYAGVQLPAPTVAVVDIGADEFVDTRSPKVGGADNDPRNPPTTDPDGDLIFDPFDNCSGTANVHQVDSNGDGIGDVCANAVPAVYFVDNTLPPPPAWPAGPQPDGLTWATAFRTIQEAIDAADLHNLDLSDLAAPPAKPWWTKNAEVWVRGGGVVGGQTYTENIALWHGVAVYGAWKGPDPPTKPLGELPTDVPDPHAYRDLDANQTVIDGNSNGSAVEIAHLPQDRYLVDPNAPNYDTNLKTRYDLTITVLDSFREINGLAEIGGGVSVYKDLANVSTNRVTGNQAALGGGVYLYAENGIVGDGLAPPPAQLLAGSTFIRSNTATGPVSYAGYGGGVYIEKGAPIIFAELIEGNTAYFGGGVAVRDADPEIKETLIGCLTLQNTATGLPDIGNGLGGGIYMDLSSNVIMNKDTVVSNLAQGASAQGGGIWSFDSNLLMKNTILATNVSGGVGAAIWAGATAPPAAQPPWLTCPWCFITYSDFYSNTPTTTAFVGLPDPTTAPTSECSLCPDTNLALDPQFVDPNTCNYSLSTGSPLRGAGVPECDDPTVCPVPNIGAFQDEDPPVGIAEAKKLANGVTVQIAGAVVTAVFSDGFYVEQADRSSAIKVRVANPTVKEGQVVAVSGIMTTYGLERQVQNPTITPFDAGATILIGPLGMTNTNLGGAPVGPYVQNPLNSAGVCNLGLLVKTWGRVTSIVGGSSPGFMIDDGTGVGVKVLPAAGLSTLAVGDLVTVTGISCAEADASGKWTRAVRPRRSADVTCPLR